MSAGLLDRARRLLYALQFSGKQYYRYSSYTDGFDDSCPFCEKKGHDFSRDGEMLDRVWGAEDIGDHKPQCPLAAWLRDAAKELP